MELIGRNINVAFVGLKKKRSPVTVTFHQIYFLLIFVFMQNMLGDKRIEQELSQPK